MSLLTAKLPKTLEDPEHLLAFQAAPLELLHERALLQRTDTKFLLRNDDLGRVLARLSDDYGVLCSGEQRIATYRTLYFDTPDLRAFHDHRRGRRPRHKVRVRHYPDRGVSFLEVKTKRCAAVTEKWRMARPYGETSLDGRSLEFIARHCSTPATELIAQVWTNFSRITLVGFHTHERITVDRNLEFRRGSRTESLAGVAIMEVKQAPFSSGTPVMQALLEEGLRRPASASKYCAATLLLRDGLRMDRLRPMLQAIEGIRTC